MKEIPEKKGLNLYRLSENCYFKLALESYVSVTLIIIDSETAEPEFNSGHGLAPNASLHRGGESRGSRGTLPLSPALREEARNGGPYLLQKVACPLFTKQGLNYLSERTGRT